MLATTAMLSFISFWRAAAIVLNDLGSSAFYAGAIAEQAIGKAAPWFILGIMLFSYAVRSMYIESCSMFVRGGVYRVVKEAMGSTLAKFSVSALMFDYILTGPISGVSAGQYLTGFLNDLFTRLHWNLILPINSTSAICAIVITVYFWWENIKGIPESSGKALRIMYVTTVMVVVMIVWCVITVSTRGAHMPPLPTLANLTFAPEALGWLRFSRLPYTVGLIGVLIGLGHSVLAMSGEETLAQVYREVEHPKLPNLEKAGLVIFTYSLVFTAGVSFFAVMIIPDAMRQQYFGNLISGLAMSFVGAGVKEAFVTMLDLAVVLQLVPFLYMHGALLKLAKQSPPGEGYYSKTTLVLAGSCGLITTILGIGVAFIPSHQIASIRLFEIKMVAGTLFLVGLAAFFFFIYGRRKAARKLGAAPAL